MKQCQVPYDRLGATKMKRRTGVINVDSVQPQVHIGMQAIPQLNPANESTNFVNAAVYYSIECGITLSGDINSMWTYGIKFSSTIKQKHIIITYSRVWKRPARLFIKL